jgi:hypothetical protein
LPVLVVLVMKACAGALQVYQFWGIRQNLPTETALPLDIFTYQMVLAGFGVVQFVTGLLALAWFGMWMGLTSRKVPVAVLKTIVFVKILPGFVLYFGQGLVMFTIAMLKSPGWFPAVLVGAAGVGVDLFFIRLAHARLCARTREVVTQAGQPGPSVGWQPPGTETKVARAGGEA